ncbi:MAG: hypothetical protein ABIW83_00970 [Allosphingosinicella sp.]
MAELGKKRAYRQPELIVIAKAEAVTKGNGSTFTDSLGNTSTRYG